MTYKDTLLYSTADVKELSLIEDNVDDKILKILIINVQDMDIEPLLGSKLMDAIKLGIYNNNLDSKFDYLYNDLLPNVFFNYIMARYTLTSGKFKNKGFGEYQDQTFTAKSSNLVRQEESFYKNTAEFYAQRVKDYICYNANLFSEYFSNTGQDLAPRPHGWDSGINC